MALNSNQIVSPGSMSTPDQKGPQNVSNTSKSMLPFVILGCLVLGLAMIGALFFLQKLGSIRPSPSAAPAVFLNVQGTGLVQSVDNNGPSATVKDVASGKIYTFKITSRTKILQANGKSIGISGIKPGSIITFEATKEAQDSNTGTVNLITVPNVKDYLPSTG